MPDSDPISSLTDTQGASLSVLAKEVGGDVLASHDSDRALAPASNAKLVTSALALDALGPEYRFETRVEAYGEVKAYEEFEGDRLAGDLVLVGSGAPDLGRDDLDELARSVADEIDAVGGDLLLDGSRFAGGQLGPGWTWGNEQHAYGARSSALALDRNVVTVEVSDPDESGGSGNSANESGGFEVNVTPDTEFVAVEADLEVSDHRDSDSEPQSDEDDLDVYADHETGKIRVEGSLQPGTDRTEQAPVARPERHCGAAFREALAEAGVTIEGEVRVTETPEREERESRTGAESDPAFIRRVRSAPVADLLREMNVPSDNFVAEQLARAVASERSEGCKRDDECKRGDGSWDEWNDAAAEFLDSLGVGACRIRDGSGLSRYNLLTARGIVALLEWAHERPWADDFFDSLPAPGEGTLDGRLDDVPGVRAKTGTITGTSALSGVLRRDGEPDVLFSVIYGGLTVEADEARERQDELVLSLA